MRTLALLSLALFVWTPPRSPEVRTIGIRIERASDRPSSATAARVSVYSDVTAENKRGVSVAEATSILAAAKGTGSSVLVGVVVSDHVGLSEYLPVLEAVASNAWLTLAFVDNDGTPDSVADNLRKRIEGAR